MHVSAIAALNTFLAVVLVGTFWRLASLHMVASSNPSISHAGRAMSFQY